MSVRTGSEPVAREAARTEFDRQVATLVRLGYPALAGLAEDAFARRLAPLAHALPQRGGEHESRIAFLIVIGAELVAPGVAMARVGEGDNRGFTRMKADELGRFAPIDGLELPLGSAYLVTDVDTGAATFDVTPDRALDAIVGAGRSPLTIPEGIALLTHHPDVLRTRNAFSMLGSRCGDRRVTAMWITGGRPRLGWCWAGAPHSWLGSASCRARLGGA